MYMCAMCKDEFEGEPSFKNACGSFCASCKNIMRSRMTATFRYRKAMRNGGCIWCGEKITPETMNRGKENDNVCYPCTKKRDWLLNAIRLSEHPAQYVARIELRESSMRKARQKELFVVSRNEPVTEGVSNDQDARLRRLETMLSKLTESLGI